MKKFRALSLVLLVPLSPVDVDETFKEPIKAPIYVTENHADEDMLYQSWEKYFGDINPKNFDNKDEYWHALINRMSELKKEGVLQQTEPADHTEILVMFSYLVIVTILMATGFYIN